MTDIPSLLSRVEAFSERHGISPATVVRKATGNPRLYDRLKDRWEMVEKDAERIDRYLSEADATAVSNGTATENRKGAA